jgi:hypothetical protein
MSSELHGVEKSMDYYLTKRKKASRSQLLSMLSLVKSGPRGIFSCPFSLNL